MSEKTVKAYVAYRTRRKEIQTRQKLELERELHAEKVALGETFLEERDAGLRIEDITVLIGNKNKSFIYEMMKAYKDQLVADEAPEDDSESDENRSSEYVIELNGNSALVVFPASDEEYSLYLHNGEVVDSPEEWLAHPKDRRAVYSKIIQEINDYKK